MTHCTRLAPSPTGALHLGNARTLLMNWLLARKFGWRILLRIEDLDGPRIKQGADRGILDDLRWLGIDWDEGPIYQSSRSAIHAEALERLIRQQDAYPCVCTRSEIESAASAPHLGDGSTIYSGTCRGRFDSAAGARAASGREPAWRFRVPDESIRCMDNFRGRAEFKTIDLGDFVVAKADGTPAYQLAVVVDDAEMGISQVVRGDDLLDSTPRQMLLYRALGLDGHIPSYWHLPLIVGADGRRLAKRHGDTRVAYYREQGASSARVLALLARWSGMDCPPDDVTPGQLVERFTPEGIPSMPVVFRAADDEWLRA